METCYHQSPLEQSYLQKNLAWKSIYMLVEWRWGRSFPQCFAGLCTVAICPDKLLCLLYISAYCWPFVPSFSYLFSKMGTEHDASWCKLEWRREASQGCSLSLCVGDCNGCWPICRQGETLVPCPQRKNLFMKPKYCGGWATVRTWIENDKMGYRCVSTPASSVVQSKTSLFHRVLVWR